MGKIRFIALKEVYHILRDPRSLTIAILMPILMTFLYGYAISLDIKNVSLAVIDYDNTTMSQDLVDAFYSSTYFTPPSQPVNRFDPEEILRKGAANAVLIIEHDFETAVDSRTNFQLGVMVDGSDNNLAAAVQNYSSAVISQFAKEQMPPDFEIPTVKLSLQMLYNPDLESSHFFVPGLVAVILLMICALLTSITIAREKEVGTLEQLMTAPVKPFQILIGKILPYIALSFLDGILVLFFAWILFRVPFQGSELLLLAFGLVYVATALSLGILISTLVRTQQVAMMLALTATMLPSVMLSGFVFAIKNMPMSLQYFSHIVPARYFVTVVRGIMLKGATLDTLAMEGVALIIITLILLTIATLRFNAGSSQ
jgi:ABC-2 type transport system permease protein